jgi:hypothetical protein
MASENNIHKLFADKGDEGLGSIDTRAVIRRSKRRRLPAQLATGAAAVLVLGGVGVVGFQALGQQAPEAETAALKDDNSRSGPESAGGIEQLYSDASADQAETLNVCAAPASTVVGSPGVALSVDFADAAIGTPSVEGTVTLTNTGDEPLVGYTAASPTITLVRDGTVVWHSNGAMIAVAIEVDLEPGESMDYPATFSPVLCSDEDDFETLGDKLPPLPSGDYEVSAALGVVGDGVSLLATGPSQTVALR